MSTIQAGAPGANDTEHVLWHPVARSVTIKVKCTSNPGVPQLPAEKVRVCKLLEPTITQPAGFPSTVIDHEKEYRVWLSGVVRVYVPLLQMRLAGFKLPMVHGGGGATVTVVEHELLHPLASVTVTV